MSASSYFFKIAGMALEFRFHDSIFPLHREKFIENVVCNLKNFSIPEEYPLYIIHFVDFLEPSIFYREKEFIYLKACRKIDSKNREIYYHVNLGEFNLLFRDAIEDILAKEGGFLLHASSQYASIIKHTFFWGIQELGKPLFLIARNLSYIRLTKQPHLFLIK